MQHAREREKEQTHQKPCIHPNVLLETYVVRDVTVQLLEWQTLQEDSALDYVMTPVYHVIL